MFRITIFRVHIPLIKKAIHFRNIWFNQVKIIVNMNLYLKIVTIYTRWKQKVISMANKMKFIMAVHLNQIQFIAFK